MPSTTYDVHSALEFVGAQIISQLVLVRNVVLRERLEGGIGRVVLRQLAPRTVEHPLSPAPSKKRDPAGERLFRRGKRLSFSPDIIHWGDHHILMHARRGAWWDGNKIGLSPPPLETAEGRRMPYRLGLALLDLEDPRVVSRGNDERVFAPEETFERFGDVNSAAFPCGWILDKHSGTLRVYYGGADTGIALATAQIAELLDYIKSCPADRQDIILTIVPLERRQDVHRILRLETAPSARTGLG